MINPFKLFLPSLLLAALLALSTLQAQTTPPAAAAEGDTPAPADANAGKTENISLLQTLNQGGPMMYPLYAAECAGLYFVLDGLIFTFRVGRLAPPALVAKLKEVLNSGNYQEAWNICKTNRCFLSSVLSAGLERVGRGKDAVDFAVEESAVRESTILRTNMTYLSVIGVVAPMIGLTGTVMGMISAFRTLGSSGIADPSKLAASIGEVLVATASGLIVAVPAFIFYYIIRARAQTTILVAESRIYKLIDEIPYDQLSGLRIGDDFSAAPAPARTGINVSQKVAPAAGPSTQCPACSATIAVGTTPCPNCGTVLDWGT